ncbi:MAG: tyrosine-type recombinase/integrase [Thermoflexaceae bacterium]|nr:tyrosine-type recombinase/integrase [Thermoflexaceae bacterium]
MQRRDKTICKEGAGSSFYYVSSEWFSLQKTQWKQSSIVKYGNIMQSYLLPFFSDRLIAEITRNEVVSFSNMLLEKGGVNENGLSPKTVASIISVMKNIFEYAARIKGYNVADLTGIVIKQPQKPMKILTRAEQQKLSKYLYENLNPCNLGILVCLYTGLRVGEICALKWDDISFDEQYLYVHQTMQRLQTRENEREKTRVIISAPKSDCSIRKIPIPDDIFYLLKKCKKPENAFLLTGTGHRYMEPRTMQNHFQSVMKKCNICNINFHALRHTFATRCVELGFDIKSLSEILGHASVNITLNRYVHPSMELKQKNMNKLSELFPVR